MFSHGSHPLVFTTASFPINFWSPEVDGWWNIKLRCDVSMFAGLERNSRAYLDVAGANFPTKFRLNVHFGRTKPETRRFSSELGRTSREHTLRHGKLQRKENENTSIRL